MIVEVVVIAKDTIKFLIVFIEEYVLLLLNISQIYDKLCLLRIFCYFFLILLSFKLYLLVKMRFL